MDWLYRLSVFAHVFFSVLLVGLALFWIIMSTVLQRRFGAEETDRLLQLVNESRWPHVAVPFRWRLPLPWISWLTLLGLWGTGVLNAKLRDMPEGILWWTKIGLFVAILTTQVSLMRRLGPAKIRLNFALLIAMVIVSGWVIR
jgi:hypothetical protein